MDSYYSYLPDEELLKECIKRVRSYIIIYNYSHKFAKRITNKSFPNSALRWWKNAINSCRALLEKKLGVSKKGFFVVLVRLFCYIRVASILCGFGFISVQI